MGSCWLQNNPQWAFWMELIPCRKLCKRLEPLAPVPSGVSVSPPGVCPVLPPSRAVGNEVEQQGNKGTAGCRLWSQVLQPY